MRNFPFNCLLAVLLAGSASNLTAQSFGVRVGLNATSATFDAGERELDVDGDLNLMLGLFANLPVGTSLLSIQPEFNYLNRGYAYEPPGVVIGTITGYERTISYVDLGVLARLNFGAGEGLGFYVGAGPQFSYAVSGRFTTNTTGDDEERDVDFDADELNRGELQFAAVGGVTFDLGLQLFAEFRYNGSFSDQSSVDDYDVSQRFIGLNAGVMVPIGR